MLYVELAWTDQDSWQVNLFLTDEQIFLIKVLSQVQQLWMMMMMNLIVFRVDKSHKRLFPQQKGTGKFIGTAHK